MDWTRTFLKERQLRFSGDTPKLRARMLGYVASGTITTDDLISLLDEVEGWGNQHVYLYTVAEPLLRDLAVESNVRDALRRRRCARLFNQPLPLVLPDVPTLSLVQWTSARLRFVWVEKRLWRDPVPTENRVEGDLEFDAFRRKESRGIVAFDVDLVTGHAQLLIQRLPRGNRYAEQKKRFENELGYFIDISHLQEFRISPGIRKMDESKEIRKRSTELQTAQGSRIILTSKSRRDDAYRDPTLRKARQAVGSNAAGRLGNFYCPTSNGAADEIHVKLYAQDQRIGIFGECSQAEVMYVLSSVRTYCT
jgi:hypothetical protein